MNSVFASVMTWVRSAAIALSCILVLFTATPTLAVGSTPSRPDEGTARMDRVYNEAEKSVRPENALKGEKVINRANQGINEVQKDADAGQMNRPENSGQATSIIDEIKDALSSAAK
jgi:hypothetical protein